MNWISVDNKDDIVPPMHRVLICYCPNWSDEGYQIATWNGKEFVYDAQPNEWFSENVEAWAIFLEAD